MYWVIVVVVVVVVCVVCLFLFHFFYVLNVMIYTCALHVVRLCGNGDCE